MRGAYGSVSECSNSTTKLAGDHIEREKTRALLLCSSAESVCLWFDNCRGCWPNDGCAGDMFHFVIMNISLQLKLMMKSFLFVPENSG